MGETVLEVEEAEAMRSFLSSVELGVRKSTGGRLEAAASTELGGARGES